MITVGQILKTARLKKNISLTKLGNLTKIKKEFILLIEKNDWDKLPEFPVVSGFVKNLSSALDLVPENVNAILRRDYPPKKLNINPKPDVVSKFTWSPKFTFAAGVIILVLIVLGYLGLEYLKFTKPPVLNIMSPTESELILNDSVRIKGSTSLDATLIVNNQPIVLDQDGNFDSMIEVNNDTKEIKFISRSRSGKVTEVVRNVKVDN